MRIRLFVACVSISPLSLSASPPELEWVKVQEDTAKCEVVDAALT